MRALAAKSATFLDHYSIIKVFLVKNAKIPQFFSVLSDPKLNQFSLSIFAS